MLYAREDYLPSALLSYVTLLYDVGQFTLLKLLAPVKDLAICRCIHKMQKNMRSMHTYACKCTHAEFGYRETRLESM
jgi:hypothetical protein